jgi:hypothetical protein
LRIERSSFYLNVSPNGEVQHPFTATDKRKFSRLFGQISSWKRRQIMYLAKEKVGDGRIAARLFANCDLKLTDGCELQSHKPKYQSVLSLNLTAFVSSRDAI